jgi:hypothetical protein
MKKTTVCFEIQYHYAPKVWLHHRRIFSEEVARRCIKAVRKACQTGYDYRLIRRETTIKETVVRESK